jgi:hypothetical protein
VFACSNRSENQRMENLKAEAHIHIKLKGTMVTKWGKEKYISKNDSLFNKEHYNWENHMGEKKSPKPSAFYTLSK